MRGAEVGSAGLDGAGGMGATCAGGVFTTPVTGSGVVDPSIDAFFCLAGSFATAAKCSATPPAGDGFSGPVKPIDRKATSIILRRPQCPS